MIRSHTVAVRAQQRNDASSRFGAFTNNVQSRVQVFRKRVEDARGPVAKDNLNRLIAIATVDTKFVSDLVKDLDQFHKDVFESLKPVVKPGQGTMVETIDESDNVFK